MSAPTAGWQPAIGRLVLIDGQDFTNTFKANPALPGGSAVALELLSRDLSTSFGLWALTLSTDWIARIDAVDHANVPDGSRWRLWVTYPAGGGRFCWIAGPVERNRA